MMAPSPTGIPPLANSAIGGNDKAAHGRSPDEIIGLSPLPASAYRMGLYVGLASILMLFMALTAAYIVRQSLSGDWKPIPLPPLLWVTTAVLVASSVTFEAARRALREGLKLRCRRWLSFTAALGIAFLIGQALTWHRLVATGVYMNTNPHSSFFYTLTGSHGLHLLGGILALVYLVIKAWRRSTPGNSDDQPELVTIGVDLTAIYWHFMDVLWVYLFILLFVWR